MTFPYDDDVLKLSIGAYNIISPVLGQPETISNAEAT